MPSDDEVFSELTFALVERYRRIPDPDPEGRVKPAFSELTDFFKVWTLYEKYHGAGSLSDVVEIYPEFEHVAAWLEHYQDFLKLYQELDQVERKREPLLNGERR